MTAASPHPEFIANGFDRKAASRKRRLSGMGWSRHRRLLLETLLPKVIDHPLERLTLVSLAELSGISLWVLRGAFGNAHGLLSAITSQAIDAALAQLSYRPREQDGVLQAVTRYARFLAERMNSPSYRNMLLLIIRNGPSVEWLAEAYEERIAARICADLEESVFRAGQQYGAPVLMRDGAARRLFKKLEAALALPALLPHALIPTAEETAQVIEDIVNEAFAETYVFEWEGQNVISPATRQRPPTRARHSPRVPPASGPSLNAAGISPLHTGWRRAARRHVLTRTAGGGEDEPAPRLLHRQKPRFSCDWAFKADRDRSAGRPPNSRLTAFNAIHRPRADAPRQREACSSQSLRVT